MNKRHCIYYYWQHTRPLDHRLHRRAIECQKWSWWYGYRLETQNSTGDMWNDAILDTVHIDYRRLPTHALVHRGTTNALNRIGLGRYVS